MPSWIWELLVVSNVDLGDSPLITALTLRSGSGHVLSLRRFPGAHGTET